VNAVIKPWLWFGLPAAVALNVLLSLYLIVMLGRFDESKRQADEAETRTTTQRTELAMLQVEVESLTKQKDALGPTVVDWQQRLKEMHEAQAVAESLNARKRQKESDIAQANKGLEDANRALVDADKQKTELTSALERIRAELVTLTRSSTDTKALARQAEEAERRINVATNALANVDARRKQLEIDSSAAQVRFDQIQKEADDLRQAREKLTADSAGLRQQIQAQKDQLATFDQKSAALRTIQATIQQEDQKLAKQQQQLAIAEARADEMESRQGRAASELAQLTNRVDQTRSQAADWGTKRDTAQQAGAKAALELAAAEKLIFESKVAQGQLAREQARLVAQVAALKKELEQSRKDGADAETRLDSAKAGLQKADADLAAARTQTQVLSVRQGEMTRESSRLGAVVERLKMEKDALEKEIGRQEAQRQKIPLDGPK